MTEKFQKVHRLKRPNPAAKALRAGPFKPQRVPDKKKALARLKARTVPVSTEE